MKRYEKIILATLLISATIAIIMVASRDAKAKTGAFAEAKDVYPVTTALLTAKKADFSDCLIDRDKVTDRETEAPETAVFESEEETVEVVTEMPTEVHVETETEVPTERYYNYTIAGVKCPDEIGDFLVAELDKYGITDQWFTIALAQMFQESHFNPNAENRNGLDKGILQYRITYWDWSRGDIFDWRAQIRLYVEQTARRLASGCSIWETVSRHNTSDYGTYNQEYVDQVFQWLAPE